MKTLRWIILVAALWSVSVGAEVRMWTGEDGEKFRGEFTRELLGRIQVRDVKQTLHLIPIRKLSKSDIKYLQTTICPEVKIQVRQSSRIRPIMEWTIAGDRTILNTFKVTLNKKSNMDSQAKLTVELYVIGTMVDSDAWVLVERATSKFVFPEGKKSQYEFVVKDVPCRKYEANWANDGLADLWRGVEYLGYVAVVLDPQGEVFAYDTDLGTENWLEIGVPEAVEKLHKLYMEGRGSQFSRIFNVELEKMRVPQLPWYRRTKNPGS